MKHSDLPSIGTPLQGGTYGGVVRVAAALFAVVWAPKADGEMRAAWLPKRVDAPGTHSCCDSLANTLAMADAGSALAKWALTLQIGGHDDWCIPARDVLELGYRHFKPTGDITECTFRDGDNPSSVPAGYPYREAEPIVQTSAAAFQAGGTEAFEASWYWSSTQYSDAHAWGQNFNNGLQTSNGKSYEARARAVRLIQLDA